MKCKVTIGSGLPGGTVSPPPGPYVYDAGASVPIRAFPDPGYTFSGWNAVGGVSVASPTSDNTTMTVTGNGTLAPVFTRPKVTICTPSGGTVTPSPGTYSYAPGRSVGIKASPAPGQTFVRWNYSGGVSVTSPTSATTTMTVNGSGDLCPQFSGYHPVTVCTPSEGSVAPSPGIHSYPFGALVSIKATPAAGSSFVRWTYSGGTSVTSPTAASTTMRVTGLGTLCPQFTIPPGTVTICTPSGGSVSPSPGVHQYTVGSLVPIKATADEDYEFIRWNPSGGVSVADRYAASTTMQVTGGGTLCPEFEGNVYHTVEIKETTNGKVTPPPGNYTSPAGSWESIVATPDTGFRFLRWECTGVQVINEYAESTQIIFHDDGTVLALFERGDGLCGPDLLAHWKFDETDGDIAYDSAGTADGVLIGGAVWQPMGGQVDGALHLDGLNDCVVTDTVLDPVDGPFSVFIWVKGGAPHQVILSQDGIAGGSDWLSASSEGRLMTALGGETLTSSTVIVDDQWHEVGLTWDSFNRNRRLYVDKVIVAEDEPLGPTSSPGGIAIGAGKDFEARRYWFGLIDDVRICNSVVMP